MAEVGSAYLSILPSFKGGASAIAKQLDGAAAGDAVGRDMGKGISGAFKGAAAAVLGPAALAVAGVAAANFIKGTVKAAGDLEQSVGAVDSVFRSSAGQIHEWAKGAAQAVGLSQNAFSSSASVIGAMLTNYGVATDKVASSTNSVIGYASDLAAMFGGTTQEAVDALGAALRGEADPAERFGLSLNKTAVTAHMAATGITNQAEATLDLIRAQMEASGALGQFAREGETLQGAQQRLAAGWENVKASIGDLFLPSAAAATGALANMLPYVQRVVDGVAGLRDLFQGGGFSASIREAFGVEEDSGVVAFVERLGAGFRDAGGGFSGLLAMAQEAFWSVVEWLSTGGIQAILDALLAGRERPFQAALQVFPAVLDAVIQVLPEVVEWITQTMLPQVVTALTTLIPELASALTTLLPQLASTLVAMVPTILDGAVTLFTALLDALVVVVPLLLTTVVGMLPSLVSTLLGMVPTLLTAGLDLFLSLVQAVVEVLPGLLTTVLGMLPALITTLLGMLPDLLNAGIDLFMGLVDAVVTILPDLITTLLSDVLPALLTTVLGMLPDLLTTSIDVFLALVTAITTALPRIIAALIGVLPVLIATLVGMIPQLLGTAVTLFMALAAGLIKAVPAILSALATMGQDIIREISKIDLAEAGRLILRGFLDGLKKGFEAVKDFVGGIGDWIAENKGPKQYDLGLLVPAGGWIMTGLREGIEDELPGLEDTLGRVTRRISGLSPALGVDGLGGAASDADPIDYRRLAAEMRRVPVELDGQIVSRSVSTTMQYMGV